MKRSRSVDVLHEVRRALRILRRVEASILHDDRVAKRAGEKQKARFNQLRSKLDDGLPI